MGDETKKKVLVIDDERDLCELIKIVLTRENYSVDCATSLAEAGRKLGERPAIILLDNNLPDGMGLEYLQMHPMEFKDSLVIVITSDVNPVIEKDARSGAAVLFLQKPFSIKMMKEMIKTAA
jgi:two-component system, OmpR family, response regulator